MILLIQYHLILETLKEEFKLFLFVGHDNKDIIKQSVIMIKTGIDTRIINETAKTLNKNAAPNRYANKTAIKMNKNISILLFLKCN